MPTHSLVRHQTPELARALVPGVHLQLVIEHDDCGLEAAEHRVEECIHFVELRRPILELVVHRLQLLVRRLQLLDRRLELFVRRLELLVRRLELFVRRLKLLVGRLELLDGRLQLLVGRLHLPLRLLQGLLQPAEARHLGEGDTDSESLARPRDQRRDLQVDVAHFVAHSPFDLTQRDDMAFDRGLLDARAELDRPEGDIQILEGSSEVALRQPEERPRLEVRRDDDAVAVDDDLGNRSRLEPGLAHAPVDIDLPLDFSWPQGKSAEPRAADSGRHLREDAPLEVDGGKEVHARREGLRLPEKQKTVVA